MAHADFVHLRVHSAYSLSEGAIPVKQLIELCLERKMPAVAITDTNNLFGALEFSDAAAKAGVQPIIGCQLSITREKSETGPGEGTGTGPDTDPMVFLVQNSDGYHNLMKLVAHAYLEGEEASDPQVTLGALEKYSKGLIALTGGPSGPVGHHLVDGQLDAGRGLLERLKGIFPGNLYVEIMRHGMEAEKKTEAAFLDLAYELDLPLVATNEVFFSDASMHEAHDALICIAEGTYLTNTDRRQLSPDHGFKSATEMRALFADLPEAINNTLVIAKRSGFMVEPRAPILPPYDCGEGRTEKDELEAQAKAGLEDRLGAHPGQKREHADDSYRKRLDFELKTIADMGYPGYFLIVADFIRWAKKQGIPVGPGRGSGAGSVVAWALLITDLDPLRFGLLFERFLNPERQSMPDIDTDFCIERRSEVIEYVTERYGADKVAQIITFNRMTSKAVLKDVARVLDIPYGDADRLAKLIPVVRGKPAKLAEMIGPDSPAPEFREKYEKDPEVRRWVDMARRIEGTNKTFGVHAAGVVIAAEPLDELVPLQRNNDGQVITQYFMEDVEAMGLLKMDFLGLRNLTMIEKTIDLVEQNTGERIDPDALPAVDEATFALLARGDLEGIFQLESSGMRQIVRDLKPSSLEDISSILALYRPGPLDAGLIPKFINRKHGREAIEFACPALEPILKETYGIMVYQEQIMRIAQDLAGYSLGEADLLRRAMGKKKVAEMQKHRHQFVEGATSRGVMGTVAEALFEQMVLFAEYCFNKSHSTAYGAVTYQTAYLKAHFPVAYMAALLTVNAGSTDKVQRYIANCQAMGIEVMPPDLNASGIDFTPTGERILFGLSAVRNLGDGAIRQLLEARISGGPFLSLADLCDRIPSTLMNRRALESLIHCGALDALETNGNRAQLMADLDLVLDWANSRAKDRASGQGNLFDLLGGAAASAADGGPGDISTAPKAAPVADYPPTEKLRLEKELVGFYLSDHPLKQLGRPIRLLSAVGLGSLEEQADKARVSVVAMVPEIRQVTTRKGDRMAVLQLEDLSGSCEAVVFPKTYARLADHLMVDARLVVWGSIDRRDERVQLIVDDCRAIDDLKVLMVDLLAEEASDIAVQHRLRECLQLHRNEQEQGGMRVPVVARVCYQSESRYVRLGHQFCVNDAGAAMTTLNGQAFKASLSSPLAVA